MFERESDTYRRGLTLGLTMAEIFILLLFLLLFMLLAVYAGNAKSKQKTDAVKNDLAECVAEARELPPVKAELEQCMQGKSAADDKFAECAVEARELPPVKVELEQCKQEKSVADDKFAECTADARELPPVKAELEQCEQGKQESDKTIAQLRKQISKGINPPCWYKVEDRHDGRHEKAYYLMNIAVHDDHLQVALRPPPPGRAIDENEKPASTSYREEYARLPLAPFRPAGDMSLATFANNAEPIRSKGKDKRDSDYQIRDYSCVFYAAVWDMTGPTKKERWKHARATIEIYFPAYVVQDDPWPGDVGN